MENNKTKSSAIQKILKCGIISWVAIIALWGIGSLKYDEYFLPSPKETIDSMKELIKDGTLWSDIVASVGRVIKGWLLSIIFAVPMGLIVGNFRPVRWLVEPILSFFRFVPAIALTTLFFNVVRSRRRIKSSTYFLRIILPYVRKHYSGCGFN